MAAMRQGSGVCAAIQRNNLLSHTKDLADAIRTLMQFDSYRPELHYMRGPGPKWHAKHDHVFGSLDRGIGSSRDDNGYRALGGSRA